MGAKNTLPCIMPTIKVGRWVKWQMGGQGGFGLVLRVQDNMTKLLYRYGKHWMPLCGCAVCRSKPQWVPS
jgi:hypothetical protein